MTDHPLMCRSDPAPLPFCRSSHAKTDGTKRCLGCISLRSRLSHHSILWEEAPRAWESCLGESSSGEGRDVAVSMWRNSAWASKRRSLELDGLSDEREGCGWRIKSELNEGTVC